VCSDIVSNKLFLVIIPIENVITTVILKIQLLREIVNFVPFKEQYSLGIQWKLNFAF
jgi:hypothetical protein